MSKIVFVSCVSKKLDHPAKAKDLYISDLFNKSECPPVGYSLGYSRALSYSARIVYNCRPICGYILGVIDRSGELNVVWVMD